MSYRVAVANPTRMEMSRMESSARRHRPYALGVDVGGTFTDVALLDQESGSWWIHKVPTEPASIESGIVRGIAEIIELPGIRAQDAAVIRHGTTIATNAILESGGAKTCLITSTGFGHVLEIGRHDMPRDANVYSWVKPTRPVRPRDVIEVPERTFVGGDRQPPTTEAIAAMLSAIESRQPESVAICLINSYLSPANELLLKEAIGRARPDLPVSCSHEIVALYGEYERAMATVLNAYVKPLVQGYLGKLEARLGEAGFECPITYMQSNGGVIARAAAETQALRMALSGPAAAVSGASDAARATGWDNTISIDIGGTSADIAVATGGSVATTTEASIGAWPVGVPILDITTIGAGGGSIASVSLTGSLTVGPQSAGAVPGPACYGRGGVRPTVTDAQVVLGRIPASVAGGRLSLDRDAATEAIEHHVARPLGVDVIEAAEAIIQIVNLNMSTAMRSVSVERGLDPRDYAIIAGGGGGALHAAELAESLGMSRVLVPPSPGVLAAVGLLAAPAKSDFSETMLMRSHDWDHAAVCTAVDRARDKALARRGDQAGLAAGGPEDVVSLHMRYVGQGHELAVQLAGAMVPSTPPAAIFEQFHEVHRQINGFSVPDAPVELVAVHYSAVDPSQVTRPRRLVRTAAGVAAPQTQVVSGGVARSFAVFDRKDLAPGWSYSSPALVLQEDCTVYVPPDWSCQVDSADNLIIEKDNI
ncbi:hydantoinase/oxoprolinase family protein [Amycolatopsis sp. GM8]|uniref:hydantoinase/oxoprolinase family protein n=1 Tax=Amycolatopsis sp. GM8 TaxID=2896530 RepID=UPI001F16559B|nr:hydantoinase/oxoprolinase family protein [Amycolatopsis sp. GM8]